MRISECVANLIATESEIDRILNKYGKALIKQKDMNIAAVFPVNDWEYIRDLIKRRNILRTTMLGYNSERHRSVEHQTMIVDISVAEGTECLGQMLNAGWYVESNSVMGPTHIFYVLAKKTEMEEVAGRDIYSNTLNGDFNQYVWNELQSTIQLRNVIYNSQMQSAVTNPQPQLMANPSECSSSTPRLS